jgi:hypothetical protein
MATCAGWESFNNTFADLLSSRRSGSFPISNACKRCNFPKGRWAFLPLDGWSSPMLEAGLNTIALTVRHFEIRSRTRG